MKNWPQIRRCRGFTLIELLIVISIMAVLAALIFPALKAMHRNRCLSVAHAEMKQIDTALNNYHSQYNTFPPANPANPALNPLYYELIGVTSTNGVNGTANFQTLDNSSSVSVATYTTVFGVDGTRNCALPRAAVEASQVQTFLSPLRQNRIGSANGVKVLVTSVRGPDPKYQPLGPGTQDVNPFRYVCPGTNNPTSFDLWVDLQIDGKIYRVNNWTKRAILL